MLPSKKELEQAYNLFYHGTRKIQLKSGGGYTEIPLRSEGDGYKCSNCSKVFPSFTNNRQYIPKKTWIMIGKPLNIGKERILEVPDLCHDCYDTFKKYLVKALNDLLMLKK
jgi:hypothetical protein